MQITTERNKQMRAKAHKKLDEVLDGATEQGAVGQYGIRAHVNGGSITAVETETKEIDRTAEDT